MTLFPEYGAILRAYNGRRARRSDLPYMRHIDQGFEVLKALTTDTDAWRAWFVHPLFQLDEFFYGIASGLGTPIGPLSMSEIVANPRVVVLAMEYRAIANAYLPIHEKRAPRWPKLSTIDVVNRMLIADKIQNWRDARRFVYPKVTQAEAYVLDDYFMSWLDALQVDEERRATLNAILDADDERRKSLGVYP